MLFYFARCRAVSLSCILLSLLLVTERVSVAQTYRLTELGTYTYGAAISTTGFVTGIAGAHAFLFDGTSMKNLGALEGGKGSEGYSINTFGFITGNSDVVLSNALYEHAFFYDGSTMKDLGTFEGGSESYGRGINSAGQITGFAELSSGAIHAFLYDGSLKDLGTFGGLSSHGFGINSAGEVTGSAATPAGFDHAFLYDGSSMKDLGTLGDTTSSLGYAINSSGWVTGTAFGSDQIDHAFLYDGSSMKEIGTFEAIGSRGLAINSSGDVVGYFHTSAGQQDAFIYSNGVMQDLNSLIPITPGVQLSRAAGINDTGEIVANGVDASGHDSAFLLTPLPDPTGTASAALLTIILLMRRGRYERGLDGAPPLSRD